MPFSNRLLLPRKAGLMLTIFAALSTLAVIAQTVWSVQQDRQLTLEAERQNGLTTVRLLEEHAGQHLSEVASRLETIAGQVAALPPLTPAQPGTGTGTGDDERSQARIRTLIEDHLNNSRAAGALQFVDLRGRAWASMLDYPAYAYPTEKREFVPRLLQQPERRTLLVGQPFVRMVDGAAVLPLARNLFDGQGRHLGLISADVQLDYFSSLYAGVARNGGAVVQMFTPDGQTVLRVPKTASSEEAGPGAGALPAQAALTLAGMAAGPEEGVIEDSSLLPDGRARLQSYRRVSEFGLLIVYGRELDRLLDIWRARARDRLLFATLFIGLHLLLTRLLLLHMKRLQASEARLRDSETRFVNLFQHAPIPLALMRTDEQRLIEVNRAMLALFELPDGGWAEASPLDARHWQNPEQQQVYAAQLQAQQHVDALEARLLRLDGRVFTAQISTRLVESGALPLAIVSILDISRQRQVEQEMQELNQRLEERVLQRTEHLEQALARLKTMQSELVRSEKMAALGSLVAGIAHELNTPIGNGVTVASSIQAYTQALAEELRSARPRRSRMEQLVGSLNSGADIMLRSLDRAAALITSFKHVAVDQSSDQRRGFDLQRTLEELALMLQPMYKKQHRLELELAPGIQMDSYPGALTQVLTNFVSNAVNHAFGDGVSGSMHLRTRAAPDGQVELLFSDNGRGIAEPDLKRVFEPFFTTRLGQGGSGLGLSIVYNLVTGVLGGRIELTSTPGQGTELRLLLPLVAPQHQG